MGTLGRLRLHRFERYVKSFTICRFGTRTRELIQNPRHLFDYSILNFTASYDFLSSFEVTTVLLSPFLYFPSFSLTLFLYRTDIDHKWQRQYLVSLYFTFTLRITVNERFFPINELTRNTYSLWRDYLFFLYTYEKSKIIFYYHREFSNLLKTRLFWYLSDIGGGFA